MSASLQYSASQVLASLEVHVREADYKGWDPYDALNSALLERLTVFHPVAQRAAIHAVRLLPWNPRGLLGIRKEYNPTALSLFADMYVNLFRAENKQRHLDVAADLLKKLRSLSCIDNKEELGWGRNFKFLTSGETHEVNRPLTFLGAKLGHSLLHFYQFRATEETLTTTYRIITTMIRQGRVIRVDGLTFLGYSAESNPRLILNVAAMAARLFLEYLQAVRKDDVEIEGISLAATADALLETVLELQQPDGSWSYGYAAGGRHLGNIDFHQGFIVDCLLDIIPMLTKDSYRRNAQEAYRRGLRFLAEEQVCSDGSFRWRYPRKYPIDIHNQAQGLISLSRSSDACCQATLDRVLDFTIRNFWDDRCGCFAYQKWPIGTNRIPYIRWSQAWMGYALSEYLIRKTRS